MSTGNEDSAQNRRVEIVFQDDFDNFLFASAQAEPPADPGDDPAPFTEEGFGIAPVMDGGFDLFV